MSRVPDDGSTVQAQDLAGHADGPPARARLVRNPARAASACTGGVRTSSVPLMNSVGTRQSLRLRRNPSPRSFTP